MTMNPAMNPRAPEAKPFDGLPVGPAATPIPGTSQGQPIAKIIPIDSRSVAHASKVPPISGGTLAISPDDRYAVAADPDRDRVSVVDLLTNRLAGHVALNPGDEPGRVTFDASGRAHVALRRGGAIATIDTTTRTVLERRDVCASPRGVEFDATQKRLLVACQSGELVSMPLTGIEGIVRQPIGQDLRDIVPTANGMFVSRFKSAELLNVGADLKVADKAQPAVIRQLFPEMDGSQSIDALDPLGARRVRLATDGTVVMLHQTAREGDISLESEQHSTNPMMIGASPYGGAGSCTGVAGTAITRFDRTGKPTSTVQLSMATLAVDVALSPTTSEIAVATAGSGDPFAPTSPGFVTGATLEEAKASAASQAPIATDQTIGQVAPDVQDIVVGVVRYDLTQQIQGQAFDATGVPLPQKAPGQNGFCAGPIAVVGLPGPATAVAFTKTGTLVMQTRQPAFVFVSQPLATSDGTVPVRIDLAGASVLDTGHEIFHRDAGAGVACATCHLEGDEDGHTWRFAGQGPRRTQSLSVGLEGTAPFHWVGDMDNLGTLMENVFVGRMGGVLQAQPRLDALASWMFSIQAPKPLRAATDEAVARGHELFVGAAECGKCHDGLKLTNNQTVDVGTGLKLQVPSLIGVGHRGPWIHNGCAKTLQQRFDPACGGNEHGKTAQLTAVQIDDLVAYLESL